MTTQRQALLGMFFVLVFGILGWFTLFEGDVSFFREKIALSVFFEDGGGLRQGDPVLVAGLRWGQVADVVYDPEKPRPERVMVVLSLDQPIHLFGNHEIVIEDSTVLGGKQLIVDPGDPESGDIVADDLHGTVAPSVMKALGDVVSENRESLNHILSGLEAIVGDAQAGKGVLGELLYDEQLAENLSRAVEAVSATFENAQGLTSDLKNGKGALGKLMNDPELYDQIREIATGIEDFVTSARGLVEDARAGRGTVGLLLADETTRQDVQQALSHIAAVTDGLEAGRGTLGRLLQDPAIADNLTRITGDLAEGRGTLGRLLTDEQVYEDLTTLTGELADAATAIREGRGTLGKLLYDDEIYQELERALGVLTGSLEEAREAAPIATFLNTVFLGF